MIPTGRLVVAGQSLDSTSLDDVAVSPDGTLVAVGHPFTERVALFDAATLQPIGQPFRVGSLPWRPAFAPDGRTLFGNGSWINTATAWDMDRDSWEEQACLLAGRNLTRAEWDEYLGTDEPYRATCDRWLPGA